MIATRCIHVRKQKSHHTGKIDTTSDETSSSGKPRNNNTIPISHVHVSRALSALPVLCRTLSRPGQTACTQIHLPRLFSHHLHGCYGRRWPGLLLVRAVHYLFGYAGTKCGRELGLSLLVCINRQQTFILTRASSWVTIYIAVTASCHLQCLDQATIRDIAANVGA